MSIIAATTEAFRAASAAVVSAVGSLMAWREARRERFRCAEFTTAFVSLAAKMAAADGVAVVAEADAIERLFTLEAADRMRMRRLYDLARQDVAGYEAYAERIDRILADKPKLKQSVFESLIHVACADGILHPAEDEFLATVADRFGYSRETYLQLRAPYVADPDDPYRTLGIARGASEDEIKRAYRKLVREGHPDVLVARGAPALVVKAATAKLAAINAAYDTVMGALARKQALDHAAG